MGAGAHDIGPLAIAVAAGLESDVEAAANGRSCRRHELALRQDPLGVWSAHFELYDASLEGADLGKDFAQSSRDGAPAPGMAHGDADLFLLVVISESRGPEATEWILVGGVEMGLFDDVFLPDEARIAKALKERVDSCLHDDGPILRKIVADAVRRKRLRRRPLTAVIAVQSKDVSVDFDHRHPFRVPHVTFQELRLRLVVRIVVRPAIKNQLFRRPPLAARRRRTGVTPYAAAFVLEMRPRPTPQVPRRRHTRQRHFLRHQLRALRQLLLQELQLRQPRPGEVHHIYHTHLSTESQKGVQRDFGDGCNAGRRMSPLLLRSFVILVVVRARVEVVSSRKICAYDSVEVLWEAPDSAEEMPLVGLLDSENDIVAVAAVSEASPQPLDLYDEALGTAAQLDLLQWEPSEETIELRFVSDTNAPTIDSKIFGHMIQMTPKPEIRSCEWLSPKRLLVRLTSVAEMDAAFRSGTLTAKILPRRIKGFLKFRLLAVPGTYGLALVDKHKNLLEEKNDSLVVMDCSSETLLVAETPASTNEEEKQFLPWFEIPGTLALPGSQSLRLPDAELPGGNSYPSEGGALSFWVYLLEGPTGAH